VSDFNQPSSGGGFFESKNAVGHLILITKVHQIYHNPTNVYAGKPQPRDEAKVDLVDLDAPGQDHRERITITHPGLVNRLTEGATNVLGRIGQVPTENGNPAYVLNAHEGQDVMRAQQWVQMYEQMKYAQPQGQVQHQPAQTYAPQGQPQGDPYGQQPSYGGQAPIQAPQGGQGAQYAQGPGPVPQTGPQMPQTGYQGQPQYHPAVSPEQLAALQALQAGQQQNPAQNQQAAGPQY
jgi:hypothetical protein